MRDAGRLIGRVGDLGFGLLKPVLGGGKLARSGFFAVPVDLGAAVVFFAAASGAFDDVLVALVEVAVFFSVAIPDVFGGSLVWFLVAAAGAFATGFVVVVVVVVLVLVDGLVETVVFALGAGAGEAEAEDEEDEAF